MSGSTLETRVVFGQGGLPHPPESEPKSGQIQAERSKFAHQVASAQRQRHLSLRCGDPGGTGPGEAARRPGHDPRSEG